MEFIVGINTIVFLVLYVLWSKSDKQNLFMKITFLSLFIANLALFLSSLGFIINV